MSAIKKLKNLPQGLKWQYLFRVGKYLGYRKLESDILTLNLIEDQFVEIRIQGHSIGSIEPLKSEDVLDLYIDSMLPEIKDYEVASEYIRNHYLYRNLLFLKQSGRFNSYEIIYLPEDELGVLNGKNISGLSATRVRGFYRRRGVEQQTTLNVYIVLNDMFNIENDREIIIPNHPRNYERNGDTFMMIGFEGIKYKYIGCKFFKWTIERGDEDCKLLWSDKSLDY